MAAEAELCELPNRQVSKYSSHPDVSFWEAAYGSSWPALAQWFPDLSVSYRCEADLGAKSLSGSYGSGLAGGYGNPTVR